MKNKREMLPVFEGPECVVRVLEDNVIEFHFTKGVSIEEDTLIQLQLNLQPQQITPGRVRPGFSKHLTDQD